MSPRNLRLWKTGKKKPATGKPVAGFFGFHPGNTPKAVTREILRLDYSCVSRLIIRLSAMTMMMEKPNSLRAQEASG